MELNKKLLLTFQYRYHYLCHSECLADGTDVINELPPNTHPVVLRRYLNIIAAFIPSIGTIMGVRHSVPVNDIFSFLIFKSEHTKGNHLGFLL